MFVDIILIFTFLAVLFTHPISRMGPNNPHNQMVVLIAIVIVWIIYTIRNFLNNKK